MRHGVEGHNWSDLCCDVARGSTDKDLHLSHHLDTVDIAKSIVYVVIR